jgi:hypothetical protein
MPAWHVPCVLPCSKHGYNKGFEGSLVSGSRCQFSGESSVLISWRNTLAAFIAYAWNFQALAASEAVATDPAVVEKNRKANEACFACHSEFGFKNPPRTDMDM